MTAHTTCYDHQINPRIRGERCEVCSLLKVERKIVLMCGRSLIQKGYSLAVNDGEEITTPFTGDMKVLTPALFTTDEDYFIVRKQGKPFGWVRFIYGNSGWDVISDYTTNLEHVMEHVMDYAERQE